MSVLGPYAELKTRVLGSLTRLGETAAELGLPSLRDEITLERLPKLQDERFILVILGEFNRGKSTFVNALLGQPILPTGITPTTATLNQISWSESPTARAVSMDGTVQEMAIDDLGRYTTEGSEAAEVNLARISHLEVGFPSPFLEDKVTLVDTPGVNDLNEQRAEVTYGYLPRADAAVFLLDASQVITRSEEEFLKNRVLRRSRNKLVFVVGKTDLLDETEVQESLTYARGHLSRVVDDPVIFAVSAKRFLAGDEDASGMPTLLAYLREHIADERGRILLDNAIADALRLAGYLRQNVEIKRRSYKMTIEELEEKIQICSERLEESRQALANYHRRIEEATAGIKATAKNDLNLFSAAFLDALPAEIDRAESADLRRYLGAYIQDKFKEWLELEGEKIGALCEQLAEEIVEVVNENIRETVDELAAQFARPSAPIKIEVNTLPYDLGVFALGALGTIVMFMNIVVGGLLTVAAPILAIVLKERIAGQVRDQAKVEARKAVAEATRAIDPRMMAFIDDFASRLADFVTSAGDRLHRGISEILDSAMAERRAEGFVASQQEHTLNARVAKVEHIEETLWELKESLWTQAVSEDGEGSSTDGTPEVTPGEAPNEAPDEPVDAPAE